MSSQERPPERQTLRLPINGAPEDCRRPRRGTLTRRALRVLERQTLHLLYFQHPGSGTPLLEAKLRFASGLRPPI